MRLALTTPLFVCVVYPYLRKSIEQKERKDGGEESIFVAFVIIRLLMAHLSGNEVWIGEGRQ